MAPEPVDPEQLGAVMTRADAEGVKFINLQFVDVLGVVKSVTIPMHELSDAIEHGKWFDGSSIEGFARFAESDMYLVPDLATFRVLPWERGANTTARLICWVHTPNGDPFPGDARYALKRAIDDAGKLGYEYCVGPELEFFLFRRDERGGISPVPHDEAGYFDLSTDLAVNVRKEMVNVLEELGIPVETAHHEVAAGQHEIDLQYDTALKAADNAVTLRYALKSVAHAHGLHATFMPKPVFGINGSGMHTHQSLFSRETGDNVFADASDEYGLSDVAKQFLAGQLAHARAMCAVLAPTVNSYKRLVPGYEAPVFVSWARVNRSALIRVPKIGAGKVRSTRIELRCPDPSCNPYLAFAVMLQAGLDGIRRRLPAPEPREENLFHLGVEDRQRFDISMLPGSLEEALRELERDEVVHRALGEHLFERFVEAKRMEWNAYRTAVTPWELDRYLEVF